MVKGISKRVIVVKPPANSMFEQGIFILKEGSFSHSSVKSSDVLEEAKAVVDDYIRTHCKSKRKRHRNGMFVAISSSILTFALCCLVYTFFL